MTSNLDKSALNDSAARAAYYRQQGWWPGRKLVERYSDIVEKSPNADALIDDRGRHFTHSQLWQAASAMAERFRARGILPGDVVVIILPNWAEWHIAHLAIRQLEAIPANIPIRTDAPMLAHAIDLVSARCLVGTDDFGSKPMGDVLTAVADSCNHKIDILLIGDDASESWSSNGKLQADFQADSQVDTQADTQAEDPNLDHLMFTSSTTGMPKAVMHSSDSLASFNITIAERFDLHSGTPIFMASPLGHSVGTIHGSLLALFLGAPLVLQQHWNPDQALQMIERHGCDFTAAATPFLKDLLDAKSIGSTPKLASMRSFLCGGAQVPPALLRQAIQEFPNTFVTVLWGMTEGGVTTCVPGSCEMDKRLETAGRPTSGLEMKVVDGAGASQPAMVEGELMVRGPNMFYGYFGQDDLNRELIGTDGYFISGDRAVIDEEGYLRITGRSKDLIIRGGVNISPVPIEDAIAAHPGISSVAVVGLPDPRLGERICAVIGGAKQSLNLEELIGFAAEHGLTKHFWPEALYHIDEMPMTPAGKIRKNDVRTWLAQHLEAEAKAS